MKYYGVRYARNCHPDDLWTIYFTSSSYVADYISKHGAPDIIQIRKRFYGPNRVTESKRYEHRVLCRLNVAYRTDYLNKSNMNSLDTTKLDDPDVKARWAASMVAVRNDVNAKKKRTLGYQKKAIERAAADTRIHEFVNIKTGETITCSVTALAIKYKLNISNLSDMSTGSRMIVTGWRIANAKHVHGLTDQKKFNFVHISGATEYCNRKELEKKYDINSGNLSEMMNGNRKSCKGWRVINTK
jgi:hypothetical protein